MMDFQGKKFEMPLQFLGQCPDSESNSFCNCHRDYDPQTGRNVQSDFIGLVGGNNTYAYVENNPLALIDPQGLTAVGAQIGSMIGEALGKRSGVAYIERT